MAPPHGDEGPPIASMKPGSTIGVLRLASADPGERSLSMTLTLFLSRRMMGFYIHACLHWRLPMRRNALIDLILSPAAALLLAQTPESSTKATLPVPHVAALSPAAEQAMASVDPEKIRAHVKFLASDLLEGRGTGARGGDIAAEYIATQFALYGLQPAGDNGGYLQKVAMLGIATQDDSTFALVPEKGEPMNLRNRVDFVAMDETTRTVDDVDAPIVWIGYGIDAPEFNWNDYKGVDVKGKVLLMMPRSVS